MHWQPIETASKDGTVILVNDMNELACPAPWVAAKWLENEHWSGWVYEDELLNDSIPNGPQPTFWFDLPPVPGSRKD